MAGISPTIRQKTTVCYSEKSRPFVRLDAVQLKKYSPARICAVRVLLLEMADSYLNGGVLVEATNKQYGEGVAEYIGERIRQYYGV